jgi:hypothetical protein
MSLIFYFSEEKGSYVEIYINMITKYKNKSSKIVDKLITGGGHSSKSQQAERGLTSRSD